MSKKSKFAAVILLLVIIAGAGGYYYMPTMWANAVPDYLNKNIGSFLVIDKSDFTRKPPELVLSGVHLKNPGEFGEGDAITIGQVNVLFEDNSHDPYNIKSITVQNIKGKMIVRKDTNNMVAIHSALMDRKYQTPHDEMAKPVNLGSFIIHNNVVTSEDGKITNTLPDKNYAPTGTMADNPPVQNVVVDILGTVVEQQQAGMNDIAMQNLADKATDKIKSIGSSLKDFLTKP